MTVALTPDMIRDIEAVVGPVSQNERASAVGSAYEGTDVFDRSVATWSPPIQSVDADIIPVKGTADARVNDLARNDAYVQSGMMINQNSIVGAMYMLNAKPEMKVLGIDDETWQTEFQEEVEAKFTLGAESVNCWLDASRKLTLTGMVRLMIASVAASGEGLASCEWLRASERPFRTAIQMLDPMRLKTPFHRLPDNNVRGGVQMDRYGAPIGYWITDNPAAGLTFPTGVGMDEAKFVAARKPWGRRQIIHIVEQKRASQTRGISDMVAGLLETQIAKKFRKVTLQNAVTGAMFAATIESELPAEAVYAQLGAGNMTKPGAAAAAFGADYLNAVAAYAENAKGLRIDGAKIPHLFPGTKFQLRPVGTPGGVGQEFEQSLIRYTAALLNVSYEQLSKDYSKTNYSSMKGGINETYKFMMARKKAVADQFATMIYMLWFEEMLGKGALECMKFSKLPNYYDALMAEAFCACDWIGASRGQIDELKETQAAILRIRSGLSTWEDELGRLGKDWRKVFAQLEREQKELELRNIMLADAASLAAADRAANAENAASSEDKEEKATE